MTFSGTILKPKDIVTNQTLPCPHEAYILEGDISQIYIYIYIKLIIDKIIYVID